MDQRVLPFFSIDTDQSALNFQFPRSQNHVEFCRYFSLTAMTLQLFMLTRRRQSTHVIMSLAKIAGNHSDSNWPIKSQIKYESGK
jgi:hypothetical protein